MAFFARRRDGRYELRESIHTAKGPRARTLANFGVLTEEVLRRASGRAVRPLDLAQVWTDAARKGVPAQLAGGTRPAAYRRFVETSRLLGSAFDADAGPRQDPGLAFVELAELVDAVGAPERRPPVLEFPVLSRLAP